MKGVKLPKCFKNLLKPNRLLEVALLLVVMYLLLTNFRSVFEGFGNGGDTEVVYYYMDGCPHCTKFDSTWSDFESANGSGVSTRKVEGKSAQAECSKHGVDGFPTILAIKDGKKHETLADRTVDGLKKLAASIA